MTTQQIIDLAKEAAQAAYDAHRDDGCPAEIAYNFIRQMRHEECDSDLCAQLMWDSMDLGHDEFALFTSQYNERYSWLLRGTPSCVVISHGHGWTLQEIRDFLGSAFVHAGRIEITGLRESA